MILTTANNEVVAYEISGHAGFADKGWDIVCSAVSALSTSATNGLEEHAKVKVECKTRDGYLRCGVIDYNNLSLIEKAKVRVIIDTMVSGIEAISAQYPNFINIEVL